jgi:hypothetical protein
MSKYSIHSTKQDWLDLYKEFEIMNNTYGFNVDIKRVKKSTSFDMMDSLLHLLKKKAGISEPIDFRTKTTSWVNGKEVITYSNN